MNYSGDEQLARQLSEIAKGMRTLWHMMAQGGQQDSGMQGLQRHQFWVLAALAHGCQSMSDLAARTETSHTSLTGIVDRLVERGWVKRVRPSENRRIVQVAITAESQEVIAASSVHCVDGSRTS